MFTEETVLILGAGASWHYGYPTGEDLVEDVIEMADGIAHYLEELLQPSLALPNDSLIAYIPDFITLRNEVSLDGARTKIQEAIRELHRLSERLKLIKPLVIDYFLAWNASLENIGRLVIAAVILNCESRWQKQRNNQNRRRVAERSPIREQADNAHKLDLGKFKDGWYRFLFHKIVSDCTESKQILDSKLKIITFNYDVSLETELLDALTSIDFIDENDAEQFLSNNRIIHMYGALHDLKLPKNTLNDLHFSTFYFKNGTSILPAIHHQNDVHNYNSFINTVTVAKKSLDISLKFSKNIRTIGHHDKDGDGSASSTAQQWILNAKYIYALGYGFDKNNNKRLGLEELLKSETFYHSLPPQKLVRYTNFNNVGSVNRRAAAAFGRPNLFAPGSETLLSTKSVYDALEQDFDAFDA